MPGYLNRGIDADEAQKYPHPPSIRHFLIKNPHQAFKRAGGKLDNASFSQIVIQPDHVSVPHTLAENLDHFFRNGDGFASVSQDFIHPSCPLHPVIGGPDVEPGKEIAGEHGFELGDHYPVEIMEGFEHRKESGDLLVEQVGFNAAFVGGFGLDDIPLKVG